MKKYKTASFYDAERKWTKKKLKDRNLERSQWRETLQKYHFAKIEIKPDGEGNWITYYGFFPRYIERIMVALEEIASNI